MTTFHQVSVGLSNGQEKKLQSAMENFYPISLKLKPDNLIGEHQIMVTQTQLNKINKAKSKRKGIVLKFSQNEIRKTGGSLFSLQKLHFQWQQKLWDWQDFLLEQKKL